MAFSIITACKTCGTKNRIPAAHLADTGRCGSCQGGLRPADEPIEVDIVAAPTVHALAHELSGRALVLKVDTEAHQDLALRYNIRSIPNFIVFRGGRPAFQRAGLAS